MSASDDLATLGFKAQFNYFTEVGPAKTDSAIEQSMVDRLVNHPENGGRFTREQCAAHVHDFVHVANHYVVTDRKSA